MRKTNILILLSLLIISLIFNSFQYRALSIYKYKQNYNDTEMQATIGRLNFYLEKVDFSNFNEENLRNCLSMSERIYTLSRNSNYNNNQDVVDCFNDLDNIFTGASISKIKSVGDPIRTLLKLVVDTNNNKINPSECKKLSEYIRNKI